MLLGTASLELTGSFQVPGRQILSSLIAWTLEHSFQRDFSLQRERELTRSKRRRDKEPVEPRCGMEQLKQNIDRTWPGLD